MAPRQYVAKPLKVFAEQYFVATQPPIAGVCTDVHDMLPEGVPHAHVVNRGPYVLADTDVIVWSHYVPDQIDAVYPLAEFEDRFGNVATIAEGTE